MNQEAHVNQVPGLEDYVTVLDRFLFARILYYPRCIVDWFGELMHWTHLWMVGSLLPTCFRAASPPDFCQELSPAAWFFLVTFANVMLSKFSVYVILLKNVNILKVTRRWSGTRDVSRRPLLWCCSPTPHFSVVDKLKARFVSILIDSCLHLHKLCNTRCDHGHRIDIVSPLITLQDHFLIGLDDLEDILDCFLLQLLLLLLEIVQFVVHLLDYLVYITEVLAHTP